MFLLLGLFTLYKFVCILYFVYSSAIRPLVAMGELFLKNKPLMNE